LAEDVPTLEPSLNGYECAAMQNLTSLFRVYGKKCSIDTGKKVNKALSFLTAFFTSVKSAKSLVWSQTYEGSNVIKRRNM